MPGRLRCLKPEAVNTVLFDFANKQAINELRCQGWTFVHAFSADVRPAWDGRAPTQATDTVCSRARGKSQVFAASAAQPVSIGKERP